MHGNTKREAGKSEEEAQRGGKRPRDTGGASSVRYAFATSKKEKKKEKKRGIFIEVKTAEEGSVTSHFDQKKRNANMERKKKLLVGGSNP